MIFASLTFLYIFLPLNFILYFCTKNQSVKNAVLVLFSLVFYAWGEPVWVLLLILTAYLDFRHALSIEKNRGTNKAFVSLMLSVLTDIGIFVIFKYSGFLISNLNTLTGLTLPVPSFSLPIGISFYTFQTLTYVIDVYRGNLKPQEYFSRYLLYISLYFQLVAGPIVRYSQVEKDIVNQRCVYSSDFSSGIYRFITGLGKKVIIANTAGTFVDKYMCASLNSLSTLEAWFGIIMYTVQLYFDFSGYSDMAVGLGKMFGFHFPENFNYPYVSKSVSEFWRRWHITLGSFFRDYVYIPLGGNKSKVLRNLLITWFLTGFWHGASWNYIVWGLYNGLFIIIEKLSKPVFDKIPSLFKHMYLLVVVNVGFVFFKFTHFSHSIEYIKILFGYGNTNNTSDLYMTVLNNLIWIIIALVLCTPIMKYISNLYQKVVLSNVLVCFIANMLRIILLASILLISTCHLAGNSYNPFLYFQF